jgi:hypothetical protein
VGECQALSLHCLTVLDIYPPLADQKALCDPQGFLFSEKIIFFFCCICLKIMVLRKQSQFGS